MKATASSDVAAADVVDMLVTVGELGAAIAAEAQGVRFNPAALHVTQTADETMASCAP